MDRCEDLGMWTETRTALTGTSKLQLFQGLRTQSPMEKEDNGQGRP